MKYFILTIGILISCSIKAETYITYTDVFAEQTISLTISQGKILTEEVVVNRKTENGTKIIGNTDSSLTILSPYNNVLLYIPKSVRKSDWIHQEKGFFTNGDTRILTGDMTINDRPVQLLIEIYAGE